MFFITFFHAFFGLLKSITFSIFYRYMSVLEYDFLTNFSSLLTRKDSFFLQNWHFLVLFTIDNRLLAPNSWKRVLWTSKHHFWEVYFLWPRWNINSVCVSNEIIYCKTMIWNRNNVFHFLHLKLNFHNKKKWTSQK